MPALLRTLAQAVVEAIQRVRTVAVVSLIRLTVAVMVVVLFAACGMGRQPSLDDFAQSEKLTTAPMTPKKSTERVAWRLTEPAQGVQLNIVVPVPSPNTCGWFEEVEVSETASRVMIHAFIRRRAPGPGEVCPEDLAFESVIVSLNQAVGNRELAGCEGAEVADLYFDDPVPEEGCIKALTDL